MKWRDDLNVLSGARTRKPRSNGRTMLIDRGLGIRAAQDLVDVAGDIVDVIQLSGATGLFIDKELLRAKIKIYHDKQIDVMPGGSFAGVCIWKGVYSQFLDQAKDLGLSAVSIYDKPVRMSEAERAAAIDEALKKGFRVVTEVAMNAGSQGMTDTLAQMRRQIGWDVEQGAAGVIVALDEQEGQKLIKGGTPAETVFFEAPGGVSEMKLSIALIREFGGNVNIVLKQYQDILILETLRRGVRNPILEDLYNGTLRWESTAVEA